MSAHFSFVIPSPSLVKTTVHVEVGLGVLVWWAELVAPHDYNIEDIGLQTFESLLADGPPFSAEPGELETLVAHVTELSRRDSEPALRDADLQALADLAYANQPFVSPPAPALMDAVQAALARTEALDRFVGCDERLARALCAAAVSADSYGHAINRGERSHAECVAELLRKHAPLSSQVLRRLLGRACFDTR
jgi:hypothetical protein